MSDKKRYLAGNIDGITLMLYFILVIIGLLSVFSVEHRTTDPSIFMMEKGYMKQLLWAGVALIIGLVILFTESKFFSSIAYLSYTISLLLIIITIFAGSPSKGSHSWLNLGSISFQPGEIGKIFTSLALARFLSSPETNFQTFKHRIIATAIPMVPCLCIVLQNETGLALVYFSFFLVMYRQGLPNLVLITGFSIVVLTLATLLIETQILFYIITGATIVIAILLRKQLKRNLLMRFIIIGVWGIAIFFSQFAVPYVFKHVMKGYQIDRIYSMLGKEVPDEFLSEEGRVERKGNVSDYNVTQSKIAIGSGGLTGKGFLNGTSTKNDFVPEQNTDFIFCAIGEQFGFLGGALLILLYLGLMMRILYLADRQRSLFSCLYGYCVASILFFHFAINISMTIGLAPVIGITLPLLSYGGTSLLSFSILIFILVRLDADRQVMIR